MSSKNPVVTVSRKVIYDFGSNNGDDIPYYLEKSDLVVAVEANPSLCEQIKDRFSKEILDRRLVVEGCVLTTDSASTSQPFYVHRSNHVLSQFPEPDSAVMHEFELLQLPAKNVIDIIRKWGDPYYIKIDMEHYDQVILRELFLNDIRPPYISSESHSIDVFCILVSLGHYGSFKLVEGATVSEDYKNHKINTHSGEKKYSFPHHSAGPFGEDIKGEWLTKNNFHRWLGFAGLGWKDIHASSIDAANESYFPSQEFGARMGLSYRVRYS